MKTSTHPTVGKPAPKNGYAAFKQGFHRGRNPFDYRTQFNQWSRWDNAWQCAKWVG